MTTQFTKGWGGGLWGLQLWGSATPQIDAPQLIFRQPGINQIDVPEDTTVTVKLFDVNFDIDLTTLALVINNVLVYDGTVGFTPGYIGKLSQAAGVVTLTATPINAFEYDQLVTVTVSVSDLSANNLSEVWSFKVRSNPACYTGTQPNALEQALLQPYETYLNLEFFRNLMLANAVRTPRKAVANANNKAARVVYQLAYSTELSSVLNSFDTRDLQALATRVCERQSMFALDRELSAHKKELTAAINSFKLQDRVPDTYIQLFHDYLDSSLHTYRVSLVANLVLLGTALEQQNV